MTDASSRTYEPELVEVLDESPEALFAWLESRDLGDFTAKVLSAMRSEFGGHNEKK